MIVIKFLDGILATWRGDCNRIGATIAAQVMMLLFYEMFGTGDGLLRATIGEFRDGVMVY